MSTNKYLTRKYLSDAGIPTPGFRLATTLKEAETALLYINFPLVIKPVDNMGSRGVTKISSLEELKEGYNRAFQCSTLKQVIIEEYLEGPEYSIDAYMDNGKFHLLGLADRIFSFLPFFVEIGYTMPSTLSDLDKGALFELMEKGALAIGIKNGIIKGDLKITFNGPRIIELAVRLSGNRMSTEAIPLSNGIDAVKIAIELALGKNPKKIKNNSKEFGFAYRSLLPSVGMLKEVKGLKSSKLIKGIVDVVIKIKPGDMIPQFKCSADSIGYVIASCETREESVAKAEMARDKIRFIVES
ncbi:MAG: ATP-grasp domain-containing protein [bacterium]